MFESMMLEDLSKRKLTLFKLLGRFSEKTYSINFFENQLDYSYSRVVYLLEQIQQDFSDMTNTSFILFDSKGVHPQKEISYYLYYQYLVTESIPYQLLLSILYYPEDDLQIFCDKNFLSPASVMRKAKRLVEYLKNFGLRLNFSQLTLSGDERIIRLLFYSLIWLSAQGTNLPEVKEVSLKYWDVTTAISPFFPDSYSYSASKQIRLMVDIVYLRIKAGYPLKKKMTIPPYIPVDLQYAEAFWVKIIDEEDLLAAEAEFSAFLLVSVPNYFWENDYRLSFLNYYLEREDNLATELMKDFCTFFATKIMPDKFTWDDHSILFGNVANLLFSAAILQKPHPTLFNLIKEQSNYHNQRSENECYQKLVHFFTIFFKQKANKKAFNWFPIMIDDLTEALAFLLLPIFEHSLKENVVRVALIAESDFLLTRELTDFLQELSFTRLTAYAENNLSGFDFIIGTSPYLLPENATVPTFIFHYASGTNQYIDLYQALKKAQSQKKIADN